MSTSFLDDAASLDSPAGGWPNPRGGFLFFLGFAAIGAGMANLVPPSSRCRSRPRSSTPPTPPRSSRW